MVNVYVRGDSLAEFWAMAWYPWLLVSADALINAKPGRRLRALVAFSLIFALLIVTHNVSALILCHFRTVHCHFPICHISKSTAT